MYLWVDGIYVKAGLEKDKAALLVVLAGLRDGRKVDPGRRERLPRVDGELGGGAARPAAPRACGPRGVVGDGHLGHLGGAGRGLPGGRGAAVLEPPAPEPAGQAAAEAPGGGEEPADEDPLRRDARGGGPGEAGVPGLGDEEGRGRGRAARSTEDWERLVTFYRFPTAHWKHLRTTNPIESPFAAVRLRTSAAKRFKRVENATAVIWKTLLIAEQTFRRLDAPELLAEVAEGATYVNGVRAGAPRR